MPWRELLADRMLVAAAWLDSPRLGDWLGGAPSGLPADERRRCALLCSPEALGVASEFRERGQIVRVNILPEDIRDSRELRAEWVGLAERLCFRHRLEKLLCLDRELVEPGLEVAERLGIRLLTAPELPLPDDF